MDSAKNLHESKHAFSPRAFRKESTLLHLSFSLIETYFELTSRIIRLKKCFCCFKLLCVLSFFSGVWLCSPINCSLPGSSVHGILQARILEWVVIPSARGSSQPRDQIHISCIDRQVLYHLGSTVLSLVFANLYDNSRKLIQSHSPPTVNLLINLFYHLLTIL